MDKVFTHLVLGHLFMLSHQFIPQWSISIMELHDSVILKAAKAN